ncbi:hypothetical protein MRX96_021228 [Rhipicephalus microplus]
MYSLIPSHCSLPAAKDDKLMDPKNCQNEAATTTGVIAMRDARMHNRHRVCHVWSFLTVVTHCRVQNRFHQMVVECLSRTQLIWRHNFHSTQMRPFGRKTHRRSQ